MKTKFFENQFKFREWLENNHNKETELIVGFYKVDSGKPSMSWSESVDQALCFGWIDGVRKSIDKESYSIRFTPRRTNSIWSAINIKKIEVLTKAGLMKPEGLKAFSLRKEEKSKIYSHEKEFTELASEYINQFKQNTLAWDFFINQAPSYRKVITHWIISAKQEKTRLSRLEKVITASGQQERLI
ncbi:MAG: YdeI/OmpD-associated family protein [Cyclobacteriaceae bacterium]|nr:YdeI/OmpD-associated family protein [Cyclobacteriaceae bacterium]